MFQSVFLVIFICLFKGIDNLIVPDEVPSLLSVVYSQIPPIKKGTDSRLGWGFRLGDHADIQVLVELGPQINTRPLGNEGDKNNKRNVENNLRNTLWAQNQLLKQRRKQQQISNTEGGKWIQSWSNSMNPGIIQQQNVPEQVEGIGEIPASLVIPAELEELYGKPKNTNDNNKHPISSLFPEVLAELYGKNNRKPSIEIDAKNQEDLKIILREYYKDKVTTDKVVTTTDAKDALDNVELE